MSIARSTARSTTPVFPTVEVERLLRQELSCLAENTGAIREPWEPKLDSLAVVSVILVVESLLPGVRIAPERVVRRGGYETVDEAVRDITARLRRE